MKVFWSWQSDTPADVSKNFVRAALQDAVEMIADDLGLSEAERPEIDHDTKNEPGLVEIVATIFKKIDAANVFVADVTPVTTTGAGKLVPNPNVMIELGYALKSLGHERIILVSNSAFGGRPEDLPFDLRHRRGPIAFTLPSNAGREVKAKEKKKLATDLATALKANLGAALSKQDSEVDWKLYPVDTEDRSTWLGPDQSIHHQDFFNGSGTNTWPVAPGPRAYMRVSATSWNSKKPSRREVQAAPNDVRLWPFGSWRNGNGGANELGVVSVGVTSSGVATSATQWLEKTGEVWGFSTSISGEANNGKTYIGQNRVLKDWAIHLPKVLKFLAHFGARPPYRIEAGVEGLKNLLWSASDFHESTALEERVMHVRISRDWCEEAQLAYLAEAFSELSDAFNQPRTTSAAIAKLLPRIRE